jgi:uncharacterized protein
LQTAIAESPKSSVPYVTPFIVFLTLIAIQRFIPLPQVAEFGLRVVVMAAVIWIFSRHVIDFQVSQPFASIGIGVVVFLLWIAPDALIPGYRSHWLFQNRLNGSTHGTISAAGQNDLWLLIFRSVRAVAIVPILEELFWRAWLMRWLINQEFWKVPLGTYAAQAFWITAALFASEHGPYWDVGLMAGIAYNWWMIRTKCVGDLILAHAVTNGCLCLYVVFFQKWEYWL